MILAHGGHDVSWVGGRGTSWQFDAASVLLVLALGAGYWVLTALAARRDDPVPGRRIASWYAGVALIAVVMCSPVATWAMTGSLTAHMIQHEAMIMVAPLLLVLGVDRRLWPRPTAARPSWRWGPVAAAAAWSAVSIAWHVPAVIAAVGHRPTAHALVHATLAAAGVWLWWQVIGDGVRSAARPVGPRIAALGIVMAVGGVIGALLIASPDVVYPAALAAPAWADGVTPLLDQKIAGVLMMAIDMPLELGALLWLVADWARRGLRAETLTPVHP